MHVEDLSRAFDLGMYSSSSRQDLCKDKFIQLHVTDAGKSLGGKISFRCKVTNPSFSQFLSFVSTTASNFPRKLTGNGHNRQMHDVFFYLEFGEGLSLSVTLIDAPVSSSSDVR